jgi:hypothetical protein
MSAVGAGLIAGEAAVDIVGELLALELELLLPQAAMTSGTTATASTEISAGQRFARSLIVVLLSRRELLPDSSAVLPGAIAPDR